MKKIINAGIIGFGNSGQTFLAPFIDADPGFYLKKISTSDAVKAEKARSIYPYTEVVGTADAIIDDPTIDLVLIGTPNTSHLSLAKQALLAGKNLIVEKPFTITSQDADELIALAKQQNKIISVHHNRRFDSGHNTVKRIINSKALGTLVEYEVHYDRFRRELRLGAWREKPLPGSGILYDLGAHVIDGALDLFGLPEAITCMILTQRPGLEVEDNFEIILSYPGLKVTLKAGMLVKVAGPVYTLYGNYGTFIKYGMDVQEDALKKGFKPGMANWGIEPETIWGQLTTEENGADITSIIESEPGRYQDYFANVYQTILGEAELIVTAQQARNTIRIIELAFKSNQEKRTIPYTA